MPATLKIIDAIPENTVSVSAVLLASRPGLDASVCVRALLSGSRIPQEIVWVTDSDQRLDAGVVALKTVHVRSGATWAEACTAGLAQATGAIIAVLDAGCEPTPDWLALLASFLDSQPGTAAVDGSRRLRDLDSHQRPTVMGHIEVDPANLSWTDQPPTRTARPREVGCVSASAFVIQRAALDGIGHPAIDIRFRSRLAAHDLFARLIEKGWQLHHLGRAVIDCTQEVASSTGGSERAGSHLHEQILFAWKHLTQVRCEHLKSQLTRAAYPNLPALLFPANPPTPEQEALTWLRENQASLDAERKQAVVQAGAFQAAVEAAQARGGYSFHARQDVLDLVPADAKIIVDVGCASGVLGAALKRRGPDVQVRGVEISTEAAALAQEVLDDVFCGSAESHLPEAWPRPDCVIFADVLEHLYDPWAVLRRYRSLLRPGGKVVVSVPNIGHRSVVSGLLHGRFDYADAGILDRTHVRFFTRATAIALVEQSGFKIDRIHRNLDALVLPRWLRMAHRLGALKAYFDDCQAIQFVILASAE